MAVITDINGTLGRATNRGPSVECKSSGESRLITVKYGWCVVLLAAGTLPAGKSDDEQQDQGTDQGVDDHGIESQADFEPDLRQR